MGWPETASRSCLAPLLRALACIPRTADTRLLLVKRTDGRPPGWDRENDYDVVFRGRKVGRIWKYDYMGSAARWRTGSGTGIGVTWTGEKTRRVMRRASKLR